MTDKQFDPQTPIRTEQDVRDFFKRLVEVEELNFHPDTLFEDYHYNEDGEIHRAYNNEDTAMFNQRMKECFGVLGDKVYPIAYDIFMTHQERLVAQRANEERTETIRNVIQRYYEDEDVETNIIDLLSDIRHLCEADGVDFDNCARISEDHFSEEVAR